MTTPLFNADRHLNILPATPEGEAVTGEAIAAKFTVAVKAVTIGRDLSEDEVTQVVDSYLVGAARYNQQLNHAAIMTAFDALSKKVDANTAATVANTAAISKRVDDIEDALNKKMDAMHAHVYGDYRESIAAQNRMRAIKGEELLPVPFVDQEYAASENLAPIKRVDDIISMSSDTLRRYINAYRSKTHATIGRTRDELIKQVIGIGLAAHREEFIIYERGQTAHLLVNSPANPPVTSRRVRTRHNPVTKEEEEEE